MRKMKNKLLEKSSSCLEYVIWFFVEATQKDLKRDSGTADGQRKLILDPPTLRREISDGHIITNALR